MSFMWMYGLARDIERLAGKEIYQKYGQEIIDCLRRDYAIDGHEMLYPSDEDIIATTKSIVEYHENKNI